MFIFIIAVIVGFPILAIVISLCSQSAKKQNVVQKFSAENAIHLTHVDGLPVPDGAECWACIYENRFTFVRNNDQFNLPFSNIVDVVCKTEKEIQNNYVSSVGGAVGGALLLGPVGAIIGGRAKKKTDEIIHEYLIFAFDKDGETKFITFDCTREVGARKCITAYQNYKGTASNGVGRIVDL